MTGKVKTFQQERLTAAVNGSTFFFFFFGFVFFMNIMQQDTVVLNSLSQVLLSKYLIYTCGVFSSS